MKPRAFALVVALGLLTTGQARADGAFAPLRGYQITSWAGGDGIRLGSVRHIVQDHEGYLWMASDAGLVRFDGVRFAATGLIENAELPAVASRALSLSHDGGLWAGYVAGRGVYHIVNGEVRAIYLQNQIAGSVNAILEDPSGAVWIGHDEGLHRLIGERIEQVRLPFPGSDRRVFDLHHDRSGALWVATATGLYRQPAGGTFERLPGYAGVARGISEDADGRMWVTDEAFGFRPAERPVRMTMRGRGWSLLHDRAGNLWVATIGQGLWKVPAEPGRIARATVDAGLLSDELSGFLEDREGNLWAGSSTGLHRLRPNRASSLVDLGVVRGVAVDNTGTAWVGTTGGLIATSPARAGSPERRRTVSPAGVRTLHRAADETLWVATEAGLHRVINGRLTPLNGIPLTHISSMTSDRDGRLWICDEVEGLVSVTAGHIAHVDLEGRDVSARPVLVKADTQDRVWIALGDGTLRVIHNGIIQPFGPAEGLSHGMIFAIHDRGGGDIWVGGDQGLSHLVSGRFQTLAGQNFPDRRVMQIASDDAGNLWLALGFFGFIRVSPREIARALDEPSYRLRYPAYTTAAGTAGVPDAFSSSGAARDATGRLWFVTGRGVTILDPKVLQSEQSTETGQPRIEGVIADDHWYRARPRPVLPAGVTRLRIDYALVNLSSFDQVRFRYRLDGLDTNWVDGTGRRQASYTNVSPGQYRFRLQVAKSPNAWEDAEVDWDFSIAPAFYQARWFLGLCVLGAPLAVVGVWRLRIRQVRKELAVVYERVRLSREIHDTLLQSLAGVAMQLDAASSDARASSGTRIGLVKMRRQIEDYILETRESIWNLRSSTLDERDIVTALRGVGQRLTSGRVRFALNVSGTPRSCGSKIQTQVLRIAQEAVMNAVRHARAGQVDLNVAFAERMLRLSVADDGQGFDPAGVAGNNRHYGLIGMKERAAEIGGRCTIESTLGVGSRVIAEFPLSS